MFSNISVNSELILCKISALFNFSNFVYVSLGISEFYHVLTLCVILNNHCSLSKRMAHIQADVNVQ